MIGEVNGLRADVDVDAFYSLAVIEALDSSAVLISAHDAYGMAVELDSQVTLEDD